MMTKPVLLLLAVIACASAAAAQDKDWKKNLEKRLIETYPLTTMKGTAFVGTGAQMPKNTGAVLTVQQGGIPAVAKPDIVMRTGRVRNGRITNPEASSGTGERNMFGGTVDYIYKAGDKVFVVKLDVKDNDIYFQTITAEPIERTVRGNTQTQRYYAMIRFEFEKDYLKTASFEEVQKAIGSVLASEAQATAARTIELGQTFAQVEAILGKPENVVKLGAKTIYTYKNMKIVFMDGKVSDVQ